ncbi:MAG: hypothetical protein ACI35O_08140 [Bacillaceae bacterium]
MYKQTARNEQLREMVEYVIANYGIKANYICKLTGIGVPAFSKWRHRKNDFCSRNLDSVEKVMEGYKK